MQVTGIILAGGKSSRMGQDKALLTREGQTLLKGVVEFCNSFCDEILISSGSPEHKIGEIPLIADEIEDCGPLGGIYSCLKYARNDWSFVISVDSPFVVAEFVSFLFSQKNGFDAVVPVHKKGKEPMVALYHKNVYPIIETQLQEENYRMYNLLEKIRTNNVEVQNWLEKFPRLFTNINYPEDFKKL